METKAHKKIFRLNAIVARRIISGYVSFSPAPPEGILTELARFEAERLLSHLVNEEISAGRL